MWLLHGTTLARVESIVQRGPDIHFVEPGGIVAENFLYDEGADLDELVASCGGVIQFDAGAALDALLSLWNSLVKEIRGVP